MSINFSEGVDKHLCPCASIPNLLMNAFCYLNFFRPFFCSFLLLDRFTACPVLPRLESVIPQLSPSQRTDTVDAASQLSSPRLRLCSVAEAAPPLQPPLLARLARPALGLQLIAA